MEDNVCDLNHLDEGVIVPPRKRLLAGFKKQNGNDQPRASISASPPSTPTDVDARVKNLLSYHSSGSSISSFEEIVESSKKAALAAAKVAEAARAAAEEKAAIAARAIAAAKTALDLVAAYSEESPGRDGRVKKNKSKKQVTVHSLYKKRDEVQNDESDEEISQKLDRVVNGSPRISKLTSPSSDSKSLQRKRLKISPVIEETRLPNGGMLGRDSCGLLNGNPAVPEVNSITMPAERQNPAIEDVPEITSPNSVLPDTDFKDHITRLDSQPSEVADSLSDTTQPESSTRSVANTQIAQHVENQDLSSKHSESSNEQGNNNIDEAANQVTESDATLNPSSSEDNAEPSKIRKADEGAGNMEVKQEIPDEMISVSASGHEVINEHPVSKVVGVIVAEGTKGNHEELNDDRLVTKLDPVEETSNLELTKDEKGPVLMDNQAESLVGLNSAETSAEALPLSNNLNSDDEFSGLTENYLDLRGSSTTDSSEQKLGSDTTTLEDPSTASAANNERYEDNLDNTSAKSSEPPPKLDSQNEAPLPDVDTELHIHRITETCM